jgi:hypothetical protein
LGLPPFQPALAGAYGGSLSVPDGVWPGAGIINIPPGDGQNGFFKFRFFLPESFGGAQLSLGANADCYARAFLNGHPVTSSMSSNDGQRITANGNTFAVATNTAWFNSGANELIIANANNNGLGSGVAFYGLVSFHGLPLMRQPRRPGTGRFECRIEGLTNEIYSVDISSDLCDWITVFSTNSDGSTFTFVDESVTNRARFYRMGVQQ